MRDPRKSRIVPCGVSLALGVVMAAGPRAAHAAPEPEPSPTQDARPPARSGDGGDAPGPAAPDPAPTEAGTDPAPSPRTPPADPGSPAAGDDEPSSPAAPTGGGAAGAVVASDAEGVDQAREDLEGAALGEPAAGVPERMPPLETAAWWTLFGSVALATTGGVFAGLAEQQEDRAIRLAAEVDPETGRSLLYDDHASEYEEILDRGEAYQWAARGLLIASGAALVASVVMFGVHGRRTRNKRLRATIGPGSIDVRF